MSTSSTPKVDPKKLPSCEVYFNGIPADSTEEQMLGFLFGHLARSANDVHSQICAAVTSTPHKVNPWTSIAALQVEQIANVCASKTMEILAKYAKLISNMTNVLREKQSLIKMLDGLRENAMATIVRYETQIRETQLKQMAECDLTVADVAAAAQSAIEGKEQDPELIQESEAFLKFVKTCKPSQMTKNLEKLTNAELKQLADSL